MTNQEEVVVLAQERTGNPNKNLHLKNKPSLSYSKPVKLGVTWFLTIVWSVKFAIA
jgi:hypothetical protein